MLSERNIMWAIAIMFDFLKAPMKSPNEVKLVLAL